MESLSRDTTDRVSLVAGGPFHAALRRLGLLAADHLPTRRAATALALLAWLLPGLLATAQSLVDGGDWGWRYVTDPTSHTRYLVAIWVMIATERYADGRITALARQFRAARLVSDHGLTALAAALATADRRAGSALAEGAILAVALVWSTLTARYVVELAGSSWEGTMIAGEITLSWAGEAARFVSNPLFLFLALRWIWRFLVWTALLYRIARLPLQLTALHPDRSAGLGFLTIYPGIFSGFIFAISCVIASSVKDDINSPLTTEHLSRLSGKGCEFVAQVIGVVVEHFPESGEISAVKSDICAEFVKQAQAMLPSLRSPQEDEWIDQQLRKF